MAERLVSAPTHPASRIDVAHAQNAYAHSSITQAAGSTMTSAAASASSLASSSTTQRGTAIALGTYTRKVTVTRPKHRHKEGTGCCTRSFEENVTISAAPGGGLRATHTEPPRGCLIMREDILDVTCTRTSEAAASDADDEAATCNSALVVVTFAFNDGALQLASALVKHGPCIWRAATNGIAATLECLGNPRSGDVPYVLQIS
jgi:hypothetical protein